MRWVGESPFPVWVPLASAVLAKPASLRYSAGLVALRGFGSRLRHHRRHTWTVARQCLPLRDDSDSASETRQGNGGTLFRERGRVRDAFHRGIIVPWGWG